MKRSDKLRVVLWPPASELWYWQLYSDLKCELVIAVGLCIKQFPHNQLDLSSRINTPFVFCNYCTHCSATEQDFLTLAGLHTFTAKQSLHVNSSRNRLRPSQMNGMYWSFQEKLVLCPTATQNKFQMDQKVNLPLNFTSHWKKYTILTL